MTDAEVDPRENPDYITLATAAKECGVRVQVLQELVATQTLIEGVVRSRRGHVYVSVASAPSWTQVEQMVLRLYTDQLTVVAKRIRTIETEAEAIRLDVNEAQENLDAPLGDDLVGVSILHSGYDRENARTLPGAVAKLQTDVMKLESLKRHLTEVRGVY